MSEDLKNNIKTLESRLERLKLMKTAFNKTFKNDAPNNADNTRLFEEGRDLKYLIYNFNKNEFEFVDSNKGNNNDISIPYNHISLGINACNLYMLNHIRQLNLTLKFLNINLRRYE